MLKAVIFINEKSLNPENEVYKMKKMILIMVFLLVLAGAVHAFDGICCD
jgi:hypothetical protein